MKERIVDSEIKLIPYYRNDEESLPWYQDLDVCKQVDNRDKPYDIELLHAMYDYLCAHGDCYYIEYRGKLVGDVSLRDNTEVAIVVCKEYQNRHIGRRCVRDMLTLAEEKGMDAVKANIYSFNTQSRLMFEAIGFVQTGEEWYTFDLKKPCVMLEKMGEFFDARLDSYDEHQLSTISSAEEFYPYTASLLPQSPGSAVLDLGCGTGLELEHYLKAVPDARITGIDLAPGMLQALRNKFPDRALNLILGSYFDVPFEESSYDAAVSVESLHHFTKEEKKPLYAKLRKALKPDGYFILTDYFALCGEEEQLRREELLRLKREQNIRDEAFYHYDTPLTVEHETEALLAAGFSTVTVLKNWGATYTLKAIR